MLSPTTTTGGEAETLSRLTLNFKRLLINLVKGDFGAIDENQECNNENQDKQKNGVNEDQVDKIQYNPERRRSSFSLAKLGKFILRHLFLIVKPDLIEPSGVLVLL